MNVQVSIPALTVFVQGLLSFFSPCVLPMIPLYIGYLSGGSLGKDEEGRLLFDRKKVFFHTLFFILGIGTAFLILGLGMSAVGSFFNGNRLLLARIGGILVIAIGLYQLGVFGSSKVLEREYRLPLHMEKWAMTPVTALVMGFVFSFAWTPCVGPALSTVLLMVSSAQTRALGLLLIGVYTLGFCLPFLCVGLFTTTLLDWLRRHRGIVRYTVIIGGILMILMGILMLTGKMNQVTGYLSRVSSVGNVFESDSEEESSVEESSAEESSSEESPVPESSEEESSEEESSAPESSEEESSEASVQYDFELQDQYGETRHLSDYKGKVVFLNFWATWCPPCRAEMPDIQTLYEKYKDSDDVAILAVAGPGQSGEGTAEEVAAFLEDNGYTYPVVMDETGEVMYYFQISAFPTTFMVDKNGDIFGYVTGALSLDIMEDIIQQTLESTP